MFQRLSIPVGGSEPVHKDKIFASREQGSVELLKIATFDYTGIPEYSFDAIQKSLRNISIVHNKEIFRERIFNVDFLILMGPEMKDEYAKKLKSWCGSNHDREGQYCGFSDIIQHQLPALYKNKLAGWLDLTEDILVFRSTLAGGQMAKKFLDALSP